MNNEMMQHVDSSWTLFLDRDGVINVENVGSYITGVGEFAFCPGSTGAIAQLGELFGRVVVVTNQRGVGRGIMSLDDLKAVHQHMQAEITRTGGRIDRIYACTSVDDNDHNRKPNVGMAIQAQEDYPEIDFKKSVMVGNSMSDMEFGRKLGMHTVFLTTKHAPYELPHDMIDEQYTSLQQWAATLAVPTA